MKINVDKILNWVIIVFVTGVLLISVHFLRRVYLVDQFVIPSESMLPTLIPGDRVIVNKRIFGARIYEDFDFSSDMYVKSYRTKGRRKIMLNDILVFNYPIQNGRIGFKINHVYAKRCVGLPGDSIEVGMVEMKKLSGALYIPAKGDVIEIDSLNYKLYQRVIEYETGDTLELKDVNGTEYLFENNYYFMRGDNTNNSSDSRHWGFVPEEHIIGVVTRITYSKDRTSEKYRWGRFGRKL